MSTILTFNVEDGIADELDDIIPEEGVSEQETAGATLKYYNSKLLSNKPFRNKSKQKLLHQSHSAMLNQSLSHIPKSMPMKKPMDKIHNFRKNFIIEKPITKRILTK